jgi:hypothetical protein
VLLSVGGWIHCTDVGLREGPHGHRGTATGDAELGSQCRQCELCVISHFYARCEPEVRQEGWVRGRAMLEVDCVGGGLLLVLLCAEEGIHCAEDCMFERSHGHREAATGSTWLGRQCRQCELCVMETRACCDQSVLRSLRACGVAGGLGAGQGEPGGGLRWLRAVTGVAVCRRVDGLH